MIKGEAEVSKTKGGFQKRAGRESRLWSEKPPEPSSAPIASGVPFPVIGLGASVGGLQTLGLEKEVQTKTGEWHQVRLQPYRTAGNVIEGLGLTFMDINRLKRAEQSALQARTDAESIVATVRQPLLVLDQNFCVVSANGAFHRMFKTSPRALDRQSVYELGRGEWDIPALRKLLEEILPQNTSFEDFKVEQDFSGLGRKTLMLNARRLKRETGEPEMILLAIEVVAAEAPAEKSRRQPKK